MASNAIVEVTDANFDSDVLKSDTPFFGLIRLAVLPV